MTFLCRCDKLTTHQCPRLNNDVYTYAATQYAGGQAQYNVFCGKDSSAVVISTFGTSVSYAQCAQECDKLSYCTGFSYQYEGDSSAPPTDADRPTRATCYLRSAVNLAANINANTATSGPDRATEPYNSGGGLRRDLAINVLRAAAPPTVPASAPATAWAPAANCAAGGTDVAGGRYTDRFNAGWEVLCAAGFSGTSFETADSGGQGIYRCWKGCNNRPGCVAFTFAGTYAGRSLRRICCSWLG